MNVEQKLLLHKIETADGDITVSAEGLRQILEDLGTAAKAEGYEEGRLEGRAAENDELRTAIKEFIDEL